MILKAKPSGEAVRAELERILSSRTFGPKSALHNLLAWLVEWSLSNPETAVKEYTIGVEAFGKPESYDPQQDAYVRVQASKLRAKLQEYYLTEGALDPIRIELPKRQFLIEFHDQPPPAQRHVEQATASAPAAARWPKLLLVMIALWAVAATALVVFRNPSSRTLVAESLASVWQPFLHTSRPVLISLGTHQFYSYEGGVVREPGLDAATQQQVSERLGALASALGSRPLRPSQGYTGTGQATGAFLLGRFFGTAGSPVQLVRSSTLSWDDISGHNVIFLGSAKSNPQIDAIPLERPFRIENQLIVNAVPEPGQPSGWATVPETSQQQRQEFALISFLPGLHGSGEILIIEAATTTAIWAAAMYLTDPRYAQELVNKVGGASSMPRHYQAVLRVYVRDAVPVKVVYETHRNI